MKAIDQDTKEWIVWTCCFLNVPAREAAEMYGVSHTTVQRIKKEYRDFPEKFPKVAEWSILPTSLGIAPVDLVGDFKRNNASPVVEQSLKKVEQSHKRPLVPIEKVVFGAAIALAAAVVYILFWSMRA